MKNLKTLEKESLLNSKDYELGRDKFWSLAKNPIIKELGYEPPKTEIHRFKHDHEKGCGDIFVSLALSDRLLLWEGEGRAAKGFRHDRKFAVDEMDWYLENERGNQSPKVLRGKLHNYLTHYRKSYERFYVLFAVRDEQAVEQLIYLFEEYKLPDFYWATVFNDFVSDPFEAQITCRNNTNTLSSLLSNRIE